MHDAVLLSCIHKILPFRLRNGADCVVAAVCRYNPIKTIKTSFIGTMNMLGLAKRTHARFLLTSTSEVHALDGLSPSPCDSGLASHSSWCICSVASLCMCLL